VRFQVLTAASIKFRGLWNVLPCSQVGVDRRFRGVCCLHHQGDDWGLHEKIAGCIGVQVDWADQWGMGDYRWGSGPMSDGWAVRSRRERGIMWEWDRIEFVPLRELGGNRDNGSKWSGSSDEPNGDLGCPEEDSWDNLVLSMYFKGVDKWFPWNKGCSIKT
jgi:hypothetical protein